MQFIPHTHSDETPLLEANDLEVGYDGTPILPPLNLRLRAGEFWGLIGRNGSGKTTLLRTLIGLQQPVSGSMRRDPKLRIGYVAQRSALDASLPSRVIDVVRGGLDRRWSFLNPLHGRRERDNVAMALDDMELHDLHNQQLAELSEGQKQRVMMARALVGRPNLLVLDEPTSAMDIVAERRTFALIDKVRRQRGLGVIVVSHHLALVATRATDVMFVDHEDKVSLSGCIEDVAASPFFTRRFGHFDCSAIHAPHDEHEGEDPGGHHAHDGASAEEAQT